MEVSVWMDSWKNSHKFFTSVCNVDCNMLHNATAVIYYRNIVINALYYSVSAERIT